jgi:quercetin dioxygenase-like cupin family protein
MSTETNGMDGELLAGLVDPVAPPASVRSRLLHAIEGPSRYLPFSRLVSRHFDLPLSSVQQLFERASDPKNWMVGVGPIRRYLDFQPGPAAVAPRAGLIWLSAGGRIPAHRHVDPELMVVLEGVLTDDQGRRVVAGEALELPSGSGHTVQIHDASDVLMALLHGKIHLLGT